MNIKQSKKELYRDNCKMRLEIENLIAVNSELVLLMDASKRERDEINEKINKYNRRVDNENNKKRNS